MTLHAELTDATEAAARIVDHVTPDQLGGPAPCTEWDVRALLNHLILWTSHSLERRAHTAGRARGRYICPVHQCVVTLGLGLADLLTLGRDELDRVAQARPARARPVSSRVEMSLAA